MVVALALCYCFFADRTQMFHKSHKRYSSNDFTFLAFVVTALGVLSIRRSTHRISIQNQQATTSRIDQPFLSRLQTDEWKGWMQFAILIYHYTGASRALGIYKVIRILVAAYLFMTGFGHAVFFYRKRDYSLRRSALVLVRLNLLSCILPYVMRTDYLFYYFAPLISIWYVVIYLTMRLGAQNNTSILFLVGKISISALLMTALVRVPDILEAIFACLKTAARINWDVHEWRFRMGLDLYIVYAGMLTAIAFIKISESKSVRLSSYFTQLRIISVVVAAATLGILWPALGSITEKPEYNSWVPYISVLPILSFVVIRNCNRYLRNFYSSIFAWLGRYSLETFTLQFHIWLAADTKGILRLGLGRWWDFLVVTVLFFWISWHVGRATGVITNWIIDTDEGSRQDEIEMFRLNGHLLSNISPGALPSSHDHRFTPSVFRENLKVRLAFIVVALWVLNFLY